VSHTQVRQPRSKRPYERTIVQRTRLLETLERADGRTILLVGPAGYGKTTLAHQWLERAGGAWVSVTAASGDIPVLARDLAAAIGELYPLDARRIETALQAGGSPADQARAVARTILAQVRDPLDLWMVIDDYQFLGGNPAAEELISRLERSGKFKLLVTSRERPAWATSRQRVHLDTLELGASELAMDEQEVAQLLPPDRRTVAIRREARGWPAVIALAAHAQLSDVEMSVDSLSETMFDYFAEELFEAAPAEVQRGLAAASVLPPLTPNELSEFLGAGSAVEIAATGLAYEVGGRIEVHPLARVFLLAKLRERSDSEELGRKAFELALSKRLFDEAFEVLKQIGLYDQLDRLIESAYADLIETGRIATLAEFARVSTTRGGASPPLRDLILADVGLVDGKFEHSQALAETAADTLPDGHPLLARCFLVAGRAAHLGYEFEDAFALYSQALRTASTAVDRNDSAWGVCVAALFLEDGRAEGAIAALESHRSLRPTDRVRLDTARTHHWIFGGTRRRPDFDEDIAVLASSLTDPWVRSSWSYLRGTALVLNGRYADAEKVLRNTLRESTEFRLSFAIPRVKWALAAAELGLRHFARCEAMLHQVEAHSSYSRDLHSQLNVRALRARMNLVQHRVAAAVELTAEDFTEIPSRAMYGEYLATRALSLASAGDKNGALTAARAADDITSSGDTRVLCAAARALACVDEPEAGRAASHLLEAASDSGVWDGLVCAVRASPALLRLLVVESHRRVELREVLLRSNDVALAKSVGLASRSAGPKGVLSPREREVMEHVVQGHRNAEIAASLFIAVGTVKRHLDHAYEKLGVRSRTEAVARYAEIENAETDV
jgi:ATP/maltotriose-dependent transcriptional regulator MalT